MPRNADWKVIKENKRLKIVEEPVWTSHSPDSKSGELHKVRTFYGRANGYGVRKVFHREWLW